MHELNIHCHVERPGPRYDPDPRDYPNVKDVWTHFSINLSAAFTDITKADNPLVDRYLALWRWQWLTLQIYGITRDGKHIVIPDMTESSMDPATDSGFQMVKQGLDKYPEQNSDPYPKKPDPNDPDSITPWRMLANKFEEEFAFYQQASGEEYIHGHNEYSDIFSWNPNLQNATVAVDRPASDTKVRMAWRAFLSQQWNLPAPLPILLKLAAFFRIPNTFIEKNDIVSLIAAPVFSGLPFISDLHYPGPHPPSPYTPDPQINASEQLVAMSTILADPAPPMYKWSYPDFDPELKVTAHIVPCEAIGDFQDAYPVNLKTRFVEWSDSYGDPSWTNHLPVMLADTCDLPGLLLSTMREFAATPDLPLNRNFPPEWQDAFIASLRDRAHCGVYQAPDGQILIDYLIRQLAPQTQQEVAEDIQPFIDYLHYQFTLKEWSDLLLQVLKVHNIQPVGEKPDRDHLLAFYEDAYAALSQQQILEDLIFKQWEYLCTDAPGLEPKSHPPSDVKDFWIKYQQALKTALTEIDLRRMLTLGLAGIPWSRLPEETGQHPVAERLDTADELKTFLQKELVDYWLDRFAKLPENGYLLYPRDNCELPDIPMKSIESMVTALLKAYGVIKPDVKTPEDYKLTALTAEPEGLVFRIDRSRREAKTNTHGDFYDPTRMISGTVLLLRKQGDPDPRWRCTNYAYLDLPDTPPPQDPHSPGPDFKGSFVLPRGYGYSSSFRQAVVEYRNAPLCVESPRRKLTGSSFEDGEYAYNPLLKYLNLYGKSSDLKLPALGYNSTYEALICLPSTAGGLPEEVVQRMNGQAIPWKLNDALNVNFTGKPQLHTQLLKRKTPIGQFRVKYDQSTKSDAAQSNKPVLPSIPEGVTPLARALPQVDPNDPLLLLAPSYESDSPNKKIWLPGFADQTKCKFWLFKPSVSFDVWERWAEANNEPDDKRISVMADWFRRRKSLQAMTMTAGEIAEPPGQEIDDPAVTHVKITAECLWSPTPYTFDPQIHEFKVPPEAPDGKTRGLALVQASAVTVDVQSVLTAAEKQFKLINGVLTVRIPEGHIWRLVFTPSVGQPKTVSDMEHTEAAQVHALRAQFTDGMLYTNGLAPAPMTLVVEVATAFPQDTDVLADNLHAALSVGADILHDENEIPIFLQPAKLDPAFWPYIYRVETLIQRWRWNGLPILLPKKDEDAGGQPGLSDFDIGFPFEKMVPSGLDTILPEYDGVLFASRRGDDYLVASSIAPFDLVNPQAVEIHHRRLGAGTGAQYYRFAVRVHSRYEGVLAKRSTVDSHSARRIDAENKLRPEKWKRVVALCKFHDQVPMPMIRLVIPLTQLLDNEVLVPGVMVVLDAPAYSDHLAGMAETMEARIATARLPGTETELLEFGPDPILKLAEKYTVPPEPNTDTMIGPFGYTFDTNTDAAQFTRASYLWRPPKSIDLIDPKPPEDPAHPVPAEQEKDFTLWFVKLSFRQRIQAAGYAGNLRGDQLTSRWTDGVWTRILPPATHISIQGRAESVPVKELRFEEDKEQGKRIQLKWQQDGWKPVTPQPTQSSNSELEFSYFALWTRIIPDALGRNNAETFVAFTPVEAAPPVGDKTQLGLYLVEVMHYEKWDEKQNEQWDEKKICNMLIPVPNDENTAAQPKAMIVRVTPRITVF